MLAEIVPALVVLLIALVFLLSEYRAMGTRERVSQVESDLAALIEAGLIERVRVLELRKELGLK